MAIITKDSGLLVAKATYSGIQGTIQMEFAAPTGGGPEILKINLDKIDQRSNLSFPAISGDFLGYRFLGSSFGVTATTDTATVAVIIGTGEVLPGDRTVRGLLGKIRVQTKAAIDAGVGINKERAEYSIVSSHRIQGLVLGDTAILDQGAVAFVQETGTADTIFSKFNQPTGPATFTHGSGTAKITTGGNEIIVRLDEIRLPFAIEAGDAVELLGNSVLFS